MKLSEDELTTIYFALRQREDRLEAEGQAEQLEATQRLLGRVSDALTVASIAREGK